LCTMIYCLRSKIKEKFNKFSRLNSFFLFSGFLVAWIDYRLLEVFMIGVPFNEERIWVFRDLLIVPFLGLLFSEVIPYLGEKVSKALRRVHFSSSTAADAKAKWNLIIVYTLIFIALSGWISVSFSRGYPHFAPLQITSYELEAARYIENATSERYVVIADQWMIFAGHAIVGTVNPNSFYFSHRDPEGVSLFLKMRSNPKNDTMISAMKTNNASTAYFIIEKPRLGAEEYNRIKSQALQNGLQIYQTFFYKDEEKLVIIY